MTVPLRIVRYGIALIACICCTGAVGCHSLILGLSEAAFVFLKREFS